MSRYANIELSINPGTLAARRSDPNYTQLTGRIQKELAHRLKIFCAVRELQISEAMEAAIKQYLDREEGESGKESKGR
jgi:hypothetical protein